MRVILMLSKRRFGHSVWTEHQRQHEVAQVSITLDRYSHMSPRLMSNAAAVMDRLLDEEA